MAEKRERIPREMVKALSHPTRLEILMMLQGRVASPAELAQQLDKSIGVVSYHARTLVQCGCLELIRSEPRQGTVENFFGVASHSSL